MTKTALAQAVGYTAQWGSKIESGAIALRGDDLMKVAAHLGVPASFLTQPTRIADPAGTHFRSYKVPKRDQAKAAAEANFISHILNTLLEPLNAVGPVNVPRVNANQFGTTPHARGAGAARFIREQWNLNGPVENIVGRIEEAGVFYAPMPADLEKIDGITLDRSDERPSVTLLSTSVTQARQRFTAAHELGHIVMDSTTPLTADDDVEERAHAFASYLLLPFEQVRDDLTGITPRHIDRLYSIATTWGVSPKATVEAAARNGAISRDQRRRWYQVLNGPEGKAADLLPSPYPVQPVAVKRLLDAYRGAQWTAADLAGKLDISETALTNLENNIPA